jgi:hypothetical protein
MSRIGHSRYSTSDSVHSIALVARYPCAHAFDQFLQYVVLAQGDMSRRSSARTPSRRAQGSAGAACQPAIGRRRGTRGHRIRWPSEHRRRDNVRGQHRQVDVPGHIVVDRPFAARNLARRRDFGATNTHSKWCPERMPVEWRGASSFHHSDFCRCNGASCCPRPQWTSHSASSGSRSIPPAETLCRLCL